MKLDKLDTPLHSTEQCHASVIYWNAYAAICQMDHILKLFTFSAINLLTVPSENA